MFRKYLPLSLLLVPLTLGMSCTPGDDSAVTQSTDRPAASAAKDDLAGLSDEFDSAATLRSWRHVYKDEGWSANQLEKFDIGGTQSGWMMMMPYTSTWYRDYRGVMTYKPVQGDFVVTTRLRVNRRNGSGPPQSQFSLAGIMIRTPRNITPRTWRPGSENYVFLSLGSADQAGQYQFEVKTTTYSDSNLRTSPTNSGDAIIQVARIGSSLILLKNEGGTWTVHQRYNRPDFPKTLQVGLTCYTDWPNAHRLAPSHQNDTVVKDGNPDLVALFDYVRYRRPEVPANLAGKRLDDPDAVSDADLLRFLGDAAMR
jgi:hypothetical protein